MLYASSTIVAKDEFGANIDSYPAPVLDVNGTLIGTADDVDEYVSIWNANSTNKRAGKLFPKTQFVFKLVKSRTSGCCSFGYPSFGVGCTGSTGGGSVSGLTDLELTVDGAGGPTAGTNTLTLPVAWEGKKIQVYVEGLLLLPSQYTRTATGIELLGGRLWRNDGEVEGLPTAERIVIHNYL